MAFFVHHKKPGPLKLTANPYPSRFQRWRHSLGISFILVLVVCGGLRLHKSFYESIQQMLFEGTAWIQKGIIRPFQETHLLLKDTQTFMHLKKDYAHLKHENESLKWQLQALKPLYHENRVLRQALRAPAFETYGHLTARILASPYDGLHHFFLIEAGHKEGLEKDLAVVVPEGIVGRLEKIGTHVARVLLLTDTSSRIPVMTLISEQKAILAGDGSFFPTLVYVGETQKIQQGEQVVTSGLGGIFPAGFPVGVVEDTSNGKITVRPYVPFQKLEWVHILRLHSEDFRRELTTALEGE